MLPPPYIHSDKIPAELDTILQELVTYAKAILDDNFVAAYLQGSFATGGWDDYSDVDFLIVIERQLSAEELAALHVLHSDIFERPVRWARHLDGSYFPRKALRRYDPAGDIPYYHDNGSRVLVPSHHDNTLVVRWVLLEDGITLAGPEPQALIDPVPTEALRREVLTTMQEWAAELRADSQRMNNRWYQPFVVLSYCRMLQTLQTGRIASKEAGARWAQRELDGRWTDLIERAWQERQGPPGQWQRPADPNDFQRTFEFIDYAIQVSGHFWPAAKESR